MGAERHSVSVSVQKGTFPVYPILWVRAVLVAKRLEYVKTLIIYINSGL